jgi:hypothetical protein
VLASNRMGAADIGSVALTGHRLPGAITAGTPEKRDAAALYICKMLVHPTIKEC